jgi:hypothetical protein
LDPDRSYWILTDPIGSYWIVWILWILPDPIGSQDPAGSAFSPLVYVEFLKNKISYTTIGSDSLSSCIFILMIGNIKDDAFAYLSHYPERYEPPYTSTMTMVNIINILATNIRKHMRKKLPPNIKNKLEISQLTNLHLLLGGGIVEDNNLIRDALTLLNNQNNMENLFIDSFAKYIYQQIKQNVTILKAITFSIVMIAIYYRWTILFFFLLLYTYRYSPVHF